MITQPSTHNYSEMEMNALIPKNPPVQPKPRAREFPITSVRFNQELGEGSFGKVYKGDLGGIIGGCTSIVAIKTLRPGANTKNQQDFRREIEVFTELRHQNIVCMVGVVLKDDPQCMIFEYVCQNDLHDFLMSHSPKSDSSSGDGMERMIDLSDMSFIAIQIAAGMEYLASRRFVHRDLAARNCLISDNLSVKISNFGVVSERYASDYFKIQSQTLLPVRWMSAESMLYGNFTIESDIWSYGVTLWEVYSYGLQPYYGYSNQEVIEMIHSRQLLPCPEDCPSRMYAFMVECWHEVPTRRPSFSEIHARLRHWEGMSNGYQSTSHSTCNASQYSGYYVGGNGSQHSSTGPSNNTGSTNLNGSLNGGYSQPFGHIISHPPPPPPPTLPPPVGIVQMANGPNGAPLTMLYGGHIGPMGHSSSGSQHNGQNPSVDSLQMI